MSLTTYAGRDELISYLDGGYENSDNYLDNLISKMMTTSTNGIEALPYQFMDSVDNRVAKGINVGRKYSEKIFTKLPLLFLSPCEPLFMNDFTDEEKQTALTSMLSGRSLDDLFAKVVKSNGRFYSTKYNYAEYYSYLNTMLSAVAAYLGIFETYIPTAKGTKRIGYINWQDELNDSFKTFFSSAENVVFYLDGMESVSESFTNNTGESSIASTINGYSEMAKEIRYLFGPTGQQAANLLSSGAEITSNIASGLADSLLQGGSGIVKSLSGAGVNSILNGGKIIFPKMWQDSQYSRSYNIDIKLRSPDHDSLSIFLNVLKPYCKLLALTMPRQSEFAGELDPNSYWSPFIVRAFSKGIFNIDMGIISSLNVTKGAQCCWNDDGLPTQIDIQLEIEDLYSSMAMSGLDPAGGLFQEKTILDIVNNTSYMDFLANMAGLNIAQMDIGRKMTMAYYLMRASVAQTPATLGTRLSTRASRILSSAYDFLS